MPGRTQPEQRRTGHDTPPASGGQNRLGNWGCATVALALLMSAALLIACRNNLSQQATPTRIASTIAGTTAAPALLQTLQPSARAAYTPSTAPLGARASTRTPAVTRMPTGTPAPSRTAIVAPSPTLTGSPHPTRALTSARVVEIIDGDTIGVAIDGQTYRVRYIGIDTPEIVHPGLPVEPYGPEAAEANRRLVEGQELTLERDVSDTDMYGRLLRYVYVGDRMVNGELVRLGLARANSYPPDVLYQDRLDALESEAFAAGLGIWSITPTPPSPPSERAPSSGIFIGAVEKSGKPESVVLANGALVPIDLSGWTLVSVRGNQRYRSRTEPLLQPDSRITVYSGPGADVAGGLFWTTEHVWNNSEFDPAELYDDAGHLWIAGKGERRWHSLIPFSTRISKTMRCRCRSPNAPCVPRSGTLSDPTPSGAGTSSRCPWCPRCAHLVQRTPSRR